MYSKALQKKLTYLADALSTNNNSVLPHRALQLAAHHSGDDCPEITLASLSLVFWRVSRDLKRVKASRGERFR